MCFRCDLIWNIFKIISLLIFYLSLKSFCLLVYQLFDIALLHSNFLCLSILYSFSPHELLFFCFILYFWVSHLVEVYLLSSISLYKPFFALSLSILFTHNIGFNPSLPFSLSLSMPLSVYQCLYFFSFLSYITISPWFISTASISLSLYICIPRSLFLNIALISFLADSLYLSMFLRLGLFLLPPSFTLSSSLYLFLSVAHSHRFFLLLFLPAPCSISLPLSVFLSLSLSSFYSLISIPG